MVKIFYMSVKSKIQLSLIQNIVFGFKKTAVYSGSLWRKLLMMP